MPIPLKLTYHAMKRMRERRVRVRDVVQIVESGDVIEDYPDDNPFPSQLISGTSDGRPLHVVVATDPEDEARIVITVYDPNPREWNPGFKTRRTP
jgi:hypothetical protein